MTPEQKKEQDKLLKELSGKPVQVVQGAYGDMEWCDGIVEAVITPPE